LKNWAGRRKRIQAALIFDASHNFATARRKTVRPAFILPDALKNCTGASKNWAGRRKTTQAALIFDASPSFAMARRKTVRAILILRSALKNDPGHRKTIQAGENIAASNSLRRRAVRLRGLFFVCTAR
jgi:hypothetical protein